MLTEGPTDAVVSTEGPTDDGLTQAPTDAVTTKSPSAHTGTGKIIVALLYLIAFHLDLCLDTARTVSLKSLISAKLEYAPILITWHCSAELLGKPK